MRSVSSAPHAIYIKIVNLWMLCSATPLTNVPSRQHPSHNRDPLSRLHPIHGKLYPWPIRPQKQLAVHAEPLAILRTRTSEKWTAHPADVLPLFVAEMDYPLAAPIITALVERVRASDTGYVGSPGPLAPAFVAFAQRRWGWEVDPRSIHTTTDVSVAIVETLRLAIAPGDAVVITPPVYPPFFDLVPEAGGVVVEVPLTDGADEADGDSADTDADADGGVDGGVDGGADTDNTDGVGGKTWSLDLAALEMQFAAGARAFLLCNPHNPLGLVHTRAQLEAVAALALKYGVTVVSDEIHGPLAHSDAEFVPFLSVSDAAREVGVAVTSASKAFNLAGTKCALMITASDRGDALLARLPAEVAFRTSLLGLHANVAAFTEGDAWLDGALRAIESNRQLLATLLAEKLPGVRFRMPRASYLAWLDCRDLNWGDDPAAHALDVARVALSPGQDFGTQGRGFMRLNFACSPEVLTEAVDRLAAAR
jgi:cystathionine beta-lyase